MSNPHEIIVVRNHDELSRIRVPFVYRANIIAVQEEGGNYTIIKNRYGFTYSAMEVILDEHVNNQTHFDEAIFGGLNETIHRMTNRLARRESLDDIDWVKEGF